MKRYLFKQLELWKDSFSRKPLVIKGARQVGKTWLMKEFGKKFYNKTAYISFVDSPEAIQIFEKGYNLENILLSLETLTGVSITENDTLIIFDEIQECERALNVLKFFNENASSYHVIAAGSLLGVAVREKNFSFPVGQVDFLELFPMNFCEFLEAIGEEKLARLILDYHFDITETFYEQYVNLLKLYMCVGGMPEVVKNFSVQRDLFEVRRLQKNILSGYRSDFSKYTTSSNVGKIAAIWDSVPSQLARENNKFSYKHIKEGARAREYSSALEWLTLTGLIYKVNKVTKPSLPLTGYENGAFFKIYMIDIGLLCAMSNLDFKTIIEGNTVFEEFKGALAEQFVFQEMKFLNELTICYWGSDSGNAEVDFVVQKGEQIIPIEVKASVNLKAKSLSLYRQKYQPEKAIRTSLARLEINNGLYNIPLYLIGHVMFNQKGDNN